jgi:hypothetical protein
MALYPGWWTGLVEAFGRRVDAVRIDDNVICAADEKGIYLADWSTLDEPGTIRTGQIDRLDVGDLVDERAHDYELPAPGAGWMVSAARELMTAGGQQATRRWDAGRIVPPGRAEAFTVRADVALGPATLVLRTDVSIRCKLEIEIEHAGALRDVRQLEVERSEQRAWREISLALSRIEGGDRIRLRPLDAEWRSFHFWLLRP